VSKKETVRGEPGQTAPGGGKQKPHRQKKNVTNQGTTHNLGGQTCGIRELTGFDRERTKRPNNGHNFSLKKLKNSNYER